MQALGEFKGEPLDIESMIKISVANIICNMTFGHRFDYDNEEFLYLFKLIDESLKVLGSNSVLNIYPILRFIPFDPFKIEKVQQNTFIVEDFLSKVIRQHKQNFDQNNVADFTDSYLKEMRKHCDNPDTPYTGEIKQIILLMYVYTYGCFFSLLHPLIFLFIYPIIHLSVDSLI